ncbi:MAG TPA: hypothetical protein VHN37_10420 [Actinomycetota bacterium]|nr:hypothetical protein [Actinomycetota bacterium]
MVGLAEVGNHDREASRPLAHRDSEHGLLGIGREDLDVVAEGILHHLAVKRFVLAGTDLEPEALLVLVPVELVGGRSDHLYGLSAYEADLVALEGERQPDGFRGARPALSPPLAHLTALPVVPC